MKSPRSKDVTPVGSYQSNGRFLLSSPREGIASGAAPEESPSSVRSDQHMFNFTSVAAANDSDSGKSFDRVNGLGGIATTGNSAPSPAPGSSSGNGGPVISTFKLVPLRRGNSNKEYDSEYSPRRTSTPPMLSSEKRSNSDSANIISGFANSSNVNSTSSAASRPHTAVHSRMANSSAVAALSAMDDEIFSLNSGTVSEGNRKHYPRKEALNTNNTRSNTNLFGGIAGQSEHKHGGSGVPKRNSTGDTASPLNPHARRDNEKRLSTNALVHSIFDHSVATSSPEAPNRGRTASNPVMGGRGVRFN